VTTPLAVAQIPALLAENGMSHAFIPSLDGRGHTNICVQLDGRVIGWARPTVARQLAERLRIWKTEGLHDVPSDLEIGYVPVADGGQYPGLYLFSTRARMMRPVKFLANGRDDMVGSFEQVYMDIAVKPEEIERGVTTHVEHAPTNFLSILANLTPFSDFNQVREATFSFYGALTGGFHRVLVISINVKYGAFCYRFGTILTSISEFQMGKQSMGTPSTALRHRTDNKLYRLQTGQSPVVRPKLHNTYGMDSFPNGTNAVVAVISYTGYDMEDAMILNKSAHERGFAYGTVIKSQTVDLQEQPGASKSKISPTLHFGIGNDVIVEAGPKQHHCVEFLDMDGLPRIGTRLSTGDPIAAYIDDTTHRTRFVKYKGDEVAYIDEVRLLGKSDYHFETGIMLRLLTSLVI
jgi:DNA-directed RNA polymerase I subunit RPA2